jgi:hypothetical protein
MRQKVPLRTPGSSPVRHVRLLYVCVLPSFFCFFCFFCSHLQNSFITACDLARSELSGYLKGQRVSLGDSVKTISKMYAEESAARLASSAAVAPAQKHLVTSEGTSTSSAARRTSAAQGRMAPRASKRPAPSAEDSTIDPNMLVAQDGGGRHGREASKRSRTTASTPSPAPDDAEDVAMGDDTAPAVESAAAATAADQEDDLFAEGQSNASGDDYKDDEDKDSDEVTSVVDAARQKEARDVALAASRASTFDEKVAIVVAGIRNLGLVEDWSVSQKFPRLSLSR